MMTSEMKATSLRNFGCIRSKMALVVLTLAMLGAFPTASRAGDCSIVAGKVQLKVLFLYNETDLIGWKNMFNEASTLLYNATEGNLQIGRVDFYVACQPAKDKADIWIATGNGGASANLNGCGLAGSHVFLSELHKRNDAGAHGQLGLVHELGHYIFNLRDEYGGCIKEVATGTEIPPPAGEYHWKNSFVTVQGGGKAFFCAQETGGSSCIMDGGTQVRTAFSRTEWCTAADHIGPRTVNVTVPAAGIVNSPRILENGQQCKNGASCWPQVASMLNISVPGSLSTSVPAGHQPLVFNDIGAAARFMLCLDSSGSMAGAPIALERTAANLFVQNSSIRQPPVPGDEIGVVAFGTSASVISQIREMVTAADQAAVQAAINTIQATGSTNIGGGLQTSLNQLVGQGTPGCIETILLLSDGMHNTGTNPASVIPALVARGVVVFSIGLGTQADVGVLTSVATATGGAFFFAPSAASLPAIFAEIQARVTGAAILDRVKRVLEAAESFSTPVYIDAGINEATVNISGSNLQVSLVSPNGAISNSQTQSPGVTYESGAGFQIFRISNPKAGTWVVNVTQLGAASEVNLIVTAPKLPLDSTHFAANAPTNVNFTADPNAKLVIQAALSEGPGVIGADVKAEITRPNGSVLIKQLRDDGGISSGDNAANDGIYTLTFRDFAGDGIYNFLVKADTTDGTAFIVTGEDGPPQPPVQAALGIRASSIATNVIGAPLVGPGGACCLPDFTCSDGVTEADCLADGGLYQGDATTCANVTCPQMCVLDCPNDIVQGSDPGECGATIPPPAITIGPGCNLASFSCNLPLNNFYPVGITLVTCTALDAFGQVIACSFNVTVNDTEAPSITCPPNVSVNNAPGQCGAIATYGAITASDECGAPTIQLTGGLASGSFFPVGVTTVTFTATDPAGNTASCTFTITVNDVQPPTITCPPDQSVISQTGTCTAVVNYPPPTFADNCPNPTVACVPSSGSVFQMGNTTVTCTVTDASGNTATCSFNVRVTCAKRPSGSEKGSLLIFSAVEVKWDAAGAVTQDTFIKMSNDNNLAVDVQMFFINGDPALPQQPPLPAVATERAHPGWNNVNNQFHLTADQPTYWSVLRGAPATGGLSPWTILDPGTPPGRPDLDPGAAAGARYLRGFIIAFAVNSSNEQIKWNHLSGSATTVNYALGTASEYNAWALQAVNPRLATGGVVGLPGTILFNGFEYAKGFDLLLMNFQAVNATAFSGPKLVASNTDLTLHLLSTDLRENNDGPRTTKAKFDVWNQNEVKFSNAERCLTCWHQGLLGTWAPLANHFLRANLQTNVGKARVNGEYSPVVCPNTPNNGAWSLLGVISSRLVYDAGIATAETATNLFGLGYEEGVIRYDVLNSPPPPATPQDPQDETPADEAGADELDN